MALPKLDSFVAANGTLLRTYNPSYVTVNTTDMIIDSNAVHGNGSGSFECSAWGGDVFQSAHYAQGVITALGTDYVGVAVRAQGAGSNLFALFMTSQDTNVFGYMFGGAYQPLGTGAAFQVGDLLRLEVNGTSLVAKKNSVIIYSDTLFLYGGGSGGIAASNASAASRLSSFQTGNLFGSAVPGMFIPITIPGLS